jgi:hypothetical protein
LVLFPCRRHDLVGRPADVGNERVVEARTDARIKNVARASDASFRFAAKQYNPRDGHCCPSGGSFTGRFAWNGKRLIAFVPASTVPRNLLATAKVKATLRATHLATLPGTLRPQVRGPLKGTTFYGTYRGSFYAIATFWMSKVGTTDQPELFSRAAHGGWRDRGDTGGCINELIVPPALLSRWGFHADPLNAGCWQ